MNEQHQPAYFQFLMEVLQATEESKGDARVVYSLLTKNTDKLDGVLAELLRGWGANTLEQAEANEAKSLTAVIVLFSKKISEFSLGDKASNMEIAIAGYEVALTVYTQQAFSQDWAATQNHLGVAYLNRIKGVRAENLEQAVACFQDALKVRTLEAYPVDWAATQNNIGEAFRLRIRGERAENLETAIVAYGKALKVYTFDAFPSDWAWTQYNLSSAYGDRIRGERAENLERAIAACQEALKVYTFDAFPQQWAMTQNNLGEAFRTRIRGERAANLEIAIKAYRDSLKIYTFEAFPNYWANTQHNLASAYVDRIKGERAENLELAIATYQEALQLRTFEAFPQQWAMTQINLAIAYGNRIRGERAENVELAIATYREVLTVYTFEAFPQQWAMTQANLANACILRIRGERAENLERAIAACQEALKVYTFDAFPYEWAATQTILGEAYRNRIRKERTENLELAIIAYQEALRVYTFDAFPYEWANTKNLLGNAYLERIRGMRVENLELAIATYQEALQVRTFDAFPQDWAMTQMNLATAYIYRIIGERADNLERAIAAYQEALKIYTFDALPYDWAMTQNNLGEAYRQRIRGKRANNLEMAITAYQKALIVRSCDAFPYEWAMTQNNLAAAYYNRIIGERADNLERAIVAYQEALKIYTFDAFPYEWAMTQNNLGNAYSNRIKEEQAENLEQAIAAYTTALTVRTREAIPQNYAETLVNLGMAYQNANQLTSAYTTFESAIATVESLREEIISGEETKLKQAEEWNGLYGRMVEVCLELDKIVAAIEYVERSKTRNLVEQILERDSKTIFPLEVVTQLETWRDEIATGQYQIQNGKAENPKVLAQHLQQLRQQRDELQNRYLPVGYGFKFDSFQTTLDERTAIIEWYLLEDKILAFIVIPTGKITVWQSQPEDREALENWLNQYLQNYYNQKDHWQNSLWQNSLGEELKKLASILHVDEILAQIPSQCDQLILIPHRFLHLFPLHALPISQISKNSPCLLDLFADGVNYAPSCQLLQQVQKRKRPDFQSLFAIQNPTGDLNYTDLEVQVIQAYFNTSKVLKKTAATLTEINSSDLSIYHCAHFSCHGYFNLTNVSKSALFLANAPIADTPTKPNSELYLNVRIGETHDLDKCLTLDKIFGLKLEKCRLVTLSACETGLIDFNNTSDEYIGLPSGFLLAGSSSIVSSLWKVNDLSTSFLMIKFYENLFKFDKLELGDVAIALKQAQTWLRNLTIEKLDKFLEEHKPQFEKVLAQLRVGQQKNIEESLKIIKQRQPLPFANPYYWAGFIASGR